MTSLAIVLNGPKTKNGRRVFESFKEANQQSFWNRDLVLAADSLIYMGFMRPSTLFVSAPSVHLQAMKTAWARRVLKPAEGYKIESVGDLGAIQPVEQMHYVPLGDVLCDAITQLNRLGQSATVASVRHHVATHCAHVAPPSIEMVRQTVTSLAATGLVYRMGDHLFVSVPAQSPPKQKQTVECQTGVSIIEPEKKEKKGLLARLFARRATPHAMPPVPHPVAFSTEFPPPQWMEKPRIKAPAAPPITNNRYQTVPERLCDELAIARKTRRAAQRRCRQLSSSSECLNYGPIDPPECLPGNMEVVDDLRSRRRRRAAGAKKPTARTSTPIGGSDSAYSPSPVTDSNNDEPNSGSWSEPEDVKVDHTYMNLNHDESTQFEEFSSAHMLPTSKIHISNV